MFYEYYSFLDLLLTRILTTYTGLIRKLVCVEADFLN